MIFLFFNNAGLSANIVEWARHERRQSRFVYQSQRIDECILAFSLSYFLGFLPTRQKSSMGSSSEN